MNAANTFFGDIAINPSPGSTDTLYGSHGSTGLGTFFSIDLPNPAASDTSLGDDGLGLELSCDVNHNVLEGHVCDIATQGTWYTIDTSRGRDRHLVRGRDCVPRPGRRRAHDRLNSPTSWRRIRTPSSRC